MFRTHLPMQQLEQAGHEIVMSPQMTPWGREEADVIVGQRVFSHMSSIMWQLLAREAKRTGRPRLVYELDDDVFSIDPAEVPHGDQFWDPFHRQNIIDNIEVADLVTVSTEPLADVIRKINPNVVVLPNAVPASLLDIPARKGRWLSRPITLGWQGSPTHRGDWMQCARPVGRFLKAHAQHRMIFVGMHYADTLPGEVHEQIDFNFGYKATNLDPFYAFQAAEFDVALAPLARTTFNASKSGLRFIQSAALGLPTVCSDSEAYRPWVRHGETGFLVRTEGEWTRTLRTLAHEPLTRVAVGDAARRAAADWTIEKTWTAWQDAYAALL